MDDSSGHDLISELADEFLDRKLAGESPSISEYCRRHPDLQDQIRDLFSTLELLENIKLTREHATTDCPSHPERIAEYRVDRVIGHGGMGLVYEAVHESLGRRVALKVISRRISHNKGALARFEREARAVAKLHHTNIVPLFEVGEEAGQYYLAMQLIPGESLDRVIAESRATHTDSRGNRIDPIHRGADKPTAFERNAAESSTYRSSATEILADSASSHRRHFRWIARIGLQTADALAYAHERGVIHRDIKPSNLLLDESGVVWLTDFGLAKTEDDGLTQTGELVGTLRYMAPEQFRGAIDERADVYSLGATLYELLAFRPAFGASDRLKLLSAIQTATPRRLRDINPQVPRDLETIVMKAMEKEPPSRYQSARDLADDLRRFVNDEPIQARRSKPFERLLRWSRHNKGLAAALSVSVMLLAVLVVVVSWTSIRQAELRRISDQRGDDLRRNLYFAQMNLAGQAAAQRYGTDTIRARLAEWQPAAAGQDLRNWEWYYLYALSHRESFVSEKLGNRFCWACDHSPDGTRIVNTVNAWGVQVRDAEQGTVLADRSLGSARSVDWSPDGKAIAVGRFDDVCSILEASTLETIRDLTIPSTTERYSVQWHPNSRWLAEVSECGDAKKRNEIRIHDIESGELVWSLQTPELGPRNLAWHPGGKRLACSDGSQTLVWRFTDEQPQFEFQTDGQWAIWSPDGARLAVSRPTGVWDAISGTQLAHSRGSICWGPNSKQVAVGCADGAIRIFDTTTRQLRRVLLGHASDIWSVSWSSDGRLLASCGLTDETVRTWNLSELDDNQTLAGDVGDHFVRLSNDGSMIAANATYSETIHVWDMSGRLQAKRDIPGLTGLGMASADGKRVTYFTSKFGIGVWDRVADTFVDLSADEPIEALAGNLAWHQDGKFAAAAKSGNIAVWDEAGDPLFTIAAGHGGMISSVVWNPNGSQLASTGNDAFVKIWNATTGKLQQRWEAKLGTPRDLRFSSCGKRLAGAWVGAIALWDVETGQQIAQFDEVREDFRSIDWSPDDSRIVASSPASLTLWDVKSGRVTLRMDAPTAVQNVRWSSDGMHIVAGAAGTVTIYDASRGYELNRPPE